MKHYNIPIFISHFGCPNDCAFCNQKKINGKETDITAEDIKETVERYLKTLPKKSKKEVAFFGGTFTGISQRLQIEYLEVVKEYLDSGEIDGIRVSTRPDYISDEILKILKKYGVTTIELGVQSLDEKVLEKTDRFYPVQKVEEASNLIKKYGIELGIQLMLGLPDSTFESDYQTALKTVSLKPDIARIYPTLVISQTKLAKMYKNKQYIPLSIEEGIKRAVKIYSLLEINGINIIRVGLQPTEELSDRETVLAGPYHPAFRELVVGEIYYRFLKQFNHDILEVEANQKVISTIIGLNKRNKIRLKNRLKVRIDNALTKDKIRIKEKKYEWREILTFILREE